EKDGNEICRVEGDGKLTIAGGSAITVRATEIAFKQAQSEKGGTIKVELKVKNPQDIYNVNISLINQNGSGYLSDDIDQSFVVSGDKVIITCNLPKAIQTGEYLFDEITVYQKGGTVLRYNSLYKEYYNDASGQYLLDTEGLGSKCYIKGSKTLRILSDGDEETPVLKSVKVLTPVVNKPGVIKVQVVAEDNRNISKIRMFLAPNQERKFTGDGTITGINSVYVKSFTGTAKQRTITALFTVSSQTSVKELIFHQIEITDGSGNVVIYNGELVDGERYSIKHDTGGYFVTSGIDGYTDIYYGTSPICIKEEFDIALQMGLSNTKLVSSIKNMKDGGTAKIPVSSPGIAKKELFDAIKGTSKTLIFYKNNYQWIFNGKDIKSPKDVHLDIDFRVVKGDDYGSKEKMVQIDFYKNGTLPGKANIRIKSDYTFNMFALTDSIYLYYNNEKKNELQLENGSKTALVLDDSDKWLRFDITHNSQFMATKGKLANTKSRVMKTGTIYTSKAYNCKFKVTGFKTLAYYKPLKKTIKTLNIPYNIKINGVQYSVTAILKNALANCSKLTTVKSIGNVQKIGEKAFYKCTALKKWDFNSRVVEIGKSAFEGCSSLKSFCVGLETKAIGARAFSGCKKLKKIQMAGPVKTIGGQAFKGCSSLTKIKIPASTEKIGGKAFYNCGKLKQITVLTTSLTTKKVGAYAFKGIAKNAKITVPKKKKAAYKKLFIKKGAPKTIKIK
ncbi:MAG: leucine-rich repeat domain-containing protein, partial [Eubacterium sp.]|nr:leucine-rich repeat domain-containing protein [Eubacterium sp.]